MTDPRTGWDAYFRLPEIVTEGDAALPLRGRIKIIGGTAEDNEADGLTEITVGGAGGTPGPPGPSGSDGSAALVYSLVNMSLSSQMTLDTPSGSFTVGQLFYVTETGMALIGVRFYWGVPNKDIKVSLWNAANTRLQTATVSITAAGIYTAYFTQALTQGAPYRISCWQTDGVNTSRSSTVTGVVPQRPFFVNSGYVIQGSDRYHAGDAHPDTVSGSDLYLLEPIFGTTGGAGPAAALDGLIARLARTGDDSPGIWDCEETDSDAAVMGGASGTTYNVSFRFVGVVETKHYTGGSNDGSYWQVGGAPATDLQGPNVYKLEISNPAQTYYLNRGTGASAVAAIDFQKTVPITAGATVTLSAMSVEEMDGQFRELSHSISVAGITSPAQPDLGQWIVVQVQGVSV
ncbi:MAG: hypothetical protein QOG85_860 [Gaiellaceae bacterium]|jgi:hypothetical protein|nr:hypothetical protein [Gaiellaceae bacterium]